MKFNLKSFMEGSGFCYQHFNIGSMSKNVFYQNIGAINSIHFLIIKITEVFVWL